MKPSTHRQAVWQAVFVTFLWATSWVLIKTGLKTSLPALLFAGLRYGLAFLCLSPIVLLRPEHRSVFRQISRGQWLLLIGLGILYYAVTQGAQFLSLAYLPAATVSLLLNFTPLLVLLFSQFITHERPTRTQWLGVLFSIGGVLIYFLPQGLPTDQLFGLTVAALGVIANAVSSMLGRTINQLDHIPPLVTTFISMGIGALFLLIIGFGTQATVTLDVRQWAIIGWLAVVNTAFAFTLWNHTLRVLTATESSVLNGLMLPQIAILAWLALGETLGLKQILGLVLIAIGATVTQRRAAVIASND